jgi:hypothetical protein
VSAVRPDSARGIVPTVSFAAARLRRDWPTVRASSRRTEPLGPALVPGGVPPKPGTTISLPSSTLDGSTWRECGRADQRRCVPARRRELLTFLQRPRRWCGRSSRRRNSAFRASAHAGRLVHNGQQLESESLARAEPRAGRSRSAAIVRRTHAGAPARETDGFERALAAWSLGGAVRVVPAVVAATFHARSRRALGVARALNALVRATYLVALVREGAVVVRAARLRAAFSVVADTGMANAIAGRAFTIIVRRAGDDAECGEAEEESHVARAKQRAYQLGTPSSGAAIVRVSRRLCRTVSLRRRAGWSRTRRE